MGVLRYQCTFLLFLIFRSIIRPINNKKGLTAILSKYFCKFNGDLMHYLLCEGVLIIFWGGLDFSLGGVDFSGDFVDFSRDGGFSRSESALFNRSIREALVGR